MTNTDASYLPVNERPIALALGVAATVSAGLAIAGFLAGSFIVGLIGTLLLMLMWFALTRWMRKRSNQISKDILWIGLGLAALMGARAVLPSVAIQCLYPSALVVAYWLTIAWLWKSSGPSLPT